MTAEELKKWRNRKKLTQQSAADHFGISVETWRKWEQGVNPISGLLEMNLKSYKRKR
jgi:DNA-binding transcriptional regulator YiaG